MRKWINLCENAITRPPVETIIATDAYVEELMDQNSWSRHGSPVDDFLFDMDVDEGDERDFLKQWLPKRAREVDADLMELTPLGEIHRTISVTQQWIDQLVTVDPVTVGVFFSEKTLDVQGGARGDIDITLTTTMAGCTVDWVETYRSRVDYQNGDYEQEIQLKKGTPIAVTNVFLLRDGSPIPFNPDKTFIA